MGRNELQLAGEGDEMSKENVRQPALEDGQAKLYGGR
jgi:hypothetical protein